LPYIINNLLSNGVNAREIEEAIKAAKKSGHDKAMEILQDYRLSLTVNESYH
jgi:hypothetical protein